MIAETRFPLIILFLSNFWQYPDLSPRLGIAIGYIVRGNRSKNTTQKGKICRSFKCSGRIEKK